MTGLKTKLSFFFLFLVACQQDTKIEIKPAFYYWKSVFKLNQFEKNHLKPETILYVRLFDVVNSETGPVPVAETKFLEQSKNAIIPTVFIDEKVFRNTSPVVLAEKVIKKIDQIRHSNKLKYAEIQFDCDWTQSSKMPYFEFLETCKNLKKELDFSATIRLHQVKFLKRTGVPPVKRGMLMAYNISDFKDINTENSIYEAKVLHKYTENLNGYPLPLDIALPIFRWTLIYRYERFLGIVNYKDHTDWAGIKTLKKIAPNKYYCLEACKIDNFNLAKGDILKVEEVKIQDLLNLKKHLLGLLKTKNIRLSLYHLDAKLLEKYPEKELQQIFK